MKFRLWLEMINRDSVKKIVLDAIGASKLPHEQQSQVLGSMVAVHPELMDKLKNYSELQPMLGNIRNFVQSKPNTDMIGLINYISTMNQPSSPKPSNNDYGDQDKGDYDNELNPGISPI